MPEIAVNYQPHQPPKTFKFPETIYGEQKRSFQHHWKSSHGWSMMLKKIQWLVFFASDKKSNLLSERCKKESFLKTGYKKWKKDTEKFDKHQQSKCHKSAFIYEVIVPQCRNALKWVMKWEETQGIKLAHFPYHSRNSAVFGTSKVGCARRKWRRI